MGVWPKIKKKIGAQMTPPIMNIISDPPQEGFGTGPGLTFLIKLGLFLLFLEFKGRVSSYDGEFRLPLVLAQASPIFHSSCEGKLGIALE